MYVKTLIARESIYIYIDNNTYIYIYILSLLKRLTSYSKIKIYSYLKVQQIIDE